jgi:hypothetical protein
VLAATVFFAAAGGVLAAPAPPGKHFGIEPGSFHVSSSTLQAGAHEDLTTTFDLEHSKATRRPYGDVKDVIVSLPPGFVASNTAVPTCTSAQLLASDLVSGLASLCPPASQVGTITLDITTSSEPARETYPLYNMQDTSFGVAAELGFKTVVFSQLLRIGVRPGDLGLTSTSPDVIELGEPKNVSVTVWGVPAAHSHDAERGQTCASFPIGSNKVVCEGGGQLANVVARPFLATPTSCGPSAAGIEADSWEEAGVFSGAVSEVAAMGECGRVPFDPSIEVLPSTRAAESPSGLEVSLVVPQSWDNPETLATADLKDATVTLPEGMTANPSLAAGLGACTPQEYAAESASSLPGQGCPPESKIGSIRIDTPLLAEPVEGAVYIATPYDNVPSFGDPEHPGGSLLALYVVAKHPQLGIVVKVAGKITPDPVTGRLVTTFANNPQQPFSRFTLKFRPGATAPLATPPVCGEYSASAALTPWSAPEEPRFLSSPPFQVSEGVHGGACPSGGVPPLHPQVVSGTQNNAGGTYSPFYLRLTRDDGEQELTRFSTILPPGLTGNLSGIPFCPDQAVEAVKTRTGAQELASPSCPAASRVGHTLVGAGVGPVLAQTPGSLYLAGPYHGAPLSIVSVTSATVGPFDLGTVVIRFALRINPITAQVEVDATGSDPIPHIIQGIVVHVRDIRAYIDRPGFIINPTSCERMQIQNTITGAGADPANPADQVPVSVASAFSVAECQSLQFKPSFQVSTTGKTSKANGASLSVKLAYPSAPQGTQANIRQVKVELPVQLPSRLTTLQKACTAAQFHTNPAGCPAASVVGYARAITPILPVPLEGPAYFVSNGGEAFPNLIIVLQGYGVTIDLVGDTFISKQGITSSTFKTVPDQPVTSFELTLPQGPFSALTANGNLCALTRTVLVRKKVKVRTRGRKHTIVRRVKQTLPASLSMPTEFVAQNGMTLHQNTPVSVTDCPKRKAKKAT